MAELADAVAAGPCCSGCGSTEDPDAEPAGMGEEACLLQSTPDPAGSELKELSELEELSGA